ncbi:MAG: hypothetical protein V1844_16295 [Pseudomonadota bacterium]
MNIQITNQTTLSGCTHETSYEPTVKQGKEGKGKWQTVAIEVLESLQDATERRLDDGGFDTSTARVSIEEWRKACVEKGLQHRMTWQRVKETLTSQETISIENGFVSLI